MKELFQNNELQEQLMSKFEVLFERHTKGNLTFKAADLYMSILEDEEVELAIDDIVQLAEQYDFDISDLSEEIENLK
jgi:hypothetical protein